MSRRMFLQQAAGWALLAGVASPLRAATPEVYNLGGIAINGYDPVAYFTGSNYAEGLAEHTVNWHGVEWRFATAAHKDMFKENPDAYAPQYGGYCAYAVSKGATAPTVPEAWTIHQDKLYLNFSTGVRTQWRKDIDGNIARANANWPGVLG